MMDEIDEKAIDVFITKIGDTFNLLSDEAKTFIKSNLNEDDDEYDYNTIKNLKFLVELLKIYLQ